MGVEHARLRALLSKGGGFRGMLPGKVLEILCEFSTIFFKIFWFLQCQPEFLNINCQHFDYSAVVFFRAHLHTTLGILLKYNNQVS